MADTKISAGADPGTLVATDKVPVARSASTTAYSATMAEIATWANTNLPVASTSVSGTVKVDGVSITIASGVISSASAPPASAAPPLMDGATNPGTATAWSRGDHVHPSDTSRTTQAQGDARWLQLSGGAMTGPVNLAGISTAPTPTTGDSSTKIATTAFVQAQMVASGAGVSTWNTRAGAVVLTSGDVTTALTFTPYNATNPAGYQTAAQVTTATRYFGYAINSGFSINQRGYVSGTALGSGAYAHDRWKAGVGGGTYTFTQSGGPTTTVTITAGTLQQIVETAAIAGGTYTLSWTGTALGRIGAGSYAASPVTVSGISVATMVTLEFNTGTLGQVKFEAGSVATPWIARDPQQELALCQRFYQSLAFTAYGGAVSGAVLRVPLALPVYMRAIPTMTSNFTVSSGLTSPTVNAVSPGLLSIAGTQNTTSYGADGTCTASAEL